MRRLGGVVGKVAPPINDAKMSSVWRLSELRTYRETNRGAIQAKACSVPLDLATVRFMVHKTTEGTIS